MAGPAEWCYYDFGTGVSNGWYKKGTYGGKPDVCVTAKSRPQYTPSTVKHVFSNHVIHAGTGTGLGIAALIIAVAGAGRLLATKGR